MKPLRTLLLFAVLTFALPAAFPPSSVLPTGPLPFGAAAAFAADEKKDDKPVRAFEPEELKKIAQWGSEADRSGWRKGAGVYFSPVKLVLLTLLFWCWVATTSWTNNDTQKVVDLFRYRWNTISLIVFPACFVIVLFIPVSLYFVGLPILIAAWLIPLFIYIHHRNNLDGILKADKVMTPDHLSFFFRQKLHMNVDPKKAAYETGSPIQIVGWGKRTTDAIRKGRGIAARNQLGYNYVREMVYQAINRGAVSIRVDKNAGECRFFLQLDGVWHQVNDLFDGPKKKSRPLLTEEIDSIFATIKIVAGIRSGVNGRQIGECQALYDVKKKLVIQVTSQAKQGQEEVLLSFQFAALPFHRLEELGMYPDRAKNVKDMLNSEKGMFILSAQPGQGLRTMTNVAFDTADRFTRDFATVEDVNNPGMVIENIQLNTYDSSKGESPATILPDVFFREPKVLLLRDMVNLETMKLCCQEVANDRLIITTFRGRDSVDTILRMLRTGIDPKLFAESLQFVLTQRLVRRLCPDCKEEIPANPQILRQLHLPPTIEKLYRKRVHAAPEPGQKDTYVPCARCREIGYIGRAGVYDGILINDEIRHVIMTNPTEAALRQAAMKAGNHSFLYDGAKLVADGTTSYEELVRAMKS